MILTECLKEAEAVAVGIGNEFLADKKAAVSGNDVYKNYISCGVESVLDNYTNEFIINSIFYHEITEGKNTYINERLKAYDKLAGVLTGINHFIITTCNDGLINFSSLDKTKIVAPCGSILQLQKECECADGIIRAEGYYEKLYEALEKMGENISLTQIKELMPKCEECNEKTGFNIYGTDNYNEAGYMEGWKNYTMWLQRTLNRKFALLELGVDFLVPTVIRWPFEKIAMLNNKAMLYRVNGKFPQLPSDIGEKGIAINEDSYGYVLKNF